LSNRKVFLRNGSGGVISAGDADIKEWCWLLSHLSGLYLLRHMAKDFISELKRLRPYWLLPVGSGLVKG